MIYDRDVHFKEVLESARSRLAAVLPGDVDRWLLVDIQRQILLLIVDTDIRKRYCVSTARAGINAREGSFGTPPGVHRIARKIGDDLPFGTRFSNRRPQPDPWSPDDRSATVKDKAPDLILSRILTLRGCEVGINKGSGIDSHARFIYIHGTNHESGLGQPISGGCIRLGNADIIQLFAQVEEGDPLVIL